MSLQHVQAIDDLDTRREIQILLEKLTPEERIGFLHWAADRSPTRLRPDGRIARAFVTETTGDVRESVLDLYHLIYGWDLPAGTVLAELERLAGEKGKPRRLWLPGSSCPNGV